MQNQIKPHGGSVFQWLDLPTALGGVPGETRCSSWFSCSLFPQVLGCNTGSSSVTASWFLTVHDKIQHCDVVLKKIPKFDLFICSYLFLIEKMSSWSELVNVEVNFTASDKIVKKLLYMYCHFVTWTCIYNHLKWNFPLNFLGNEGNCQVIASNLFWMGNGT